MTTPETHPIWETNTDGAVNGYLDSGHEIEISELDNEADAAKWGRTHVPGRDWVVFTPGNEILARGHADDLRAAKRAAIAATLPPIRDDVRAAHMLTPSGYCLCGATPTLTAAQHEQHLREISR